MLPERHFYTYAFRMHAELDTRIFCRILHYSSGDNPPSPHSSPYTTTKKKSYKYLQTAPEFYPTVQNSLPHIQPIFFPRSFFLSFFHHYPRRLSYVSTIIIFYPQGLLPPSPNVFSVFGWQPQHMYTLR